MQKDEKGSRARNDQRDVAISNVGCSDSSTGFLSVEHANTQDKRVTRMHEL